MNELFGRKKDKQSDSASQLTDRFKNMIAHLEELVENMRKRASTVESELNSLVRLLKDARLSEDLEVLTEDERKEIELTARRLVNLALTVEVSFKSGNQLQQEALENVHCLLDHALSRMEIDMKGTKDLIHKYHNSCLSDSKETFDPKFRDAFQGCSKNDQIRIRDTLESLVNFEVTTQLKF